MQGATAAPVKFLLPVEGTTAPLQSAGVKCISGTAEGLKKVTTVAETEQQQQSNNVSQKGGGSFARYSRSGKHWLQVLYWVILQQPVHCLTSTYCLHGNQA
ncbi:hypothetical protein ACFSKU_03615 [Pontibacter silvestris]|uniref:Uncharacterized protein n=1 Tax=Pontibacter silvestris TaxID=2305183 RepID=A0ABW4WUV4_9BACT|nr:hypothetical protein [Pontibacter silvestris]MCC9139005.1 hypothetical protein [Pontibacter silvestris]